MDKRRQKREFVLGFARELSLHGKEVHVSELARELNAHGFRVNGEPYGTTPRAICQVIQHTVNWVEKSGHPDTEARIKAIQDAFFPRPWLKKKNQTDTLTGGHHLRMSLTP